MDHIFLVPLWEGKYPSSTLADTVGFLLGGAGGGIRPPLRGPPFTYTITYDIVHVESFPLLMAKAAYLNLLTFNP